MIHHAIGRVEERGDKQVVVTLEGERGCALYGPYLDLPPGHYSVAFAIAAASRSIFSRSDPICCSVDVTAGMSDVLVSQELSVLAIAKGPVSLEFELKAKAIVEFRVHATGVVPLVVETGLKAILRPGSHGSGIDMLCAAEDQPLFAEHADRILHLAGEGIRFTVSADAIIGTWKGIRFFVRSAEDLQVADEVFVLGTYEVATGKNAVAIDIGMNVGFASLALARSERITAVHAYEPFSRPRSAAAANLDLNPTLAIKIVSNPFGLSAADSEMEVRVSNTETIGTSILGRGAGIQEQIRVADAAAVFAPILDHAARTGQDVIVKMDCEGSEFAIFETLERSDLLRGVSTFMIEWHKWWAADKTQTALIVPLLRAGFTIFDRTRESDPFAGMLYAVRSAQRHGRSPAPFVLSSDERRVRECRMAIRFEDKGEDGKVWKTPAAPARAAETEPAAAEKAAPLPYAKPVRPEKKRKGR